VAPAGSEVLAVALPDARKGERIVALVVSDHPLEDLKRTLQGELAPIMMPAALYPVPAIPKLGTGKTDLGTAKQWAQQFCAAG